MTNREEFVNALESMLNNMAESWLKREEIINVLECLMPDEIVKVWNYYVEWANDFDSMIYSMHEINSMIDSSLPLNILHMFYSAIHDGEFNPADDFYHIDKYGDYKSCNCPCEANSPVRFGELADFIIEQKKDFDIAAIREIIAENTIKCHMEENRRNNHARTD